MGEGPPVSECRQCGLFIIASHQAAHRLACHDGFDRTDLRWHADQEAIKRSAGRTIYTCLACEYETESLTKIEAHLAYRVPCDRQHRVAAIAGLIGRRRST